METPKSSPMLALLTGSRRSSEDHPLSLLKRAGSSVKTQQRFVFKTTQAVIDNQLSHTVAAFLPTGLIKQLQEAVSSSKVNPRIPLERPGVYLTLAFSSLHGLPDLPMGPGQAEMQLKRVFARVMDIVHEGGGEVLRVTPETALCVWSLLDPNDETSGTPDASNFDQARLREAAMAAGKCAQALLERLNGYVLWADTSFEAHAKARAERRALLAAKNQPPSASDATPVPAVRSALVGGGKMKSMWGKANEKVSSALPGKATKGFDFLGAVKVANKRAETGEGFEVKLSVGAAITLAVAQAVHVGGIHERWEYVVVAKEIGEAHQVLTQVDYGDVLISESLWPVFPSKALQPHISTDEWKRLPEGSSLEVSKQTIEKHMLERLDVMKLLPLRTMRPYVPGPIWAKILAGDPQWISEHTENRTITILLIRMKAPKETSLFMQVSAYAAAVNVVQQALYREYGTFKHMIQDNEGCTIAACLGLPPFEHSEVKCSRGAIQVALSVRQELAAMGLNACAAAVCGQVWIGAVGNENRREYAAIGGPMQLAAQMLSFTNDETPIIVDTTTSQANKTKYNFTTLSMSISIQGQMKKHHMLALKEPRNDQLPDDLVAPPISYDVARWLKLHNKHVAKASIVEGTLSDSAIYQMRECFTALDKDQSGEISIHELLEAIKEVDSAEPDDPRSLASSVGEMMKDMDQDDSGFITFDEFLAMVSGAYDDQTKEDTTKQQATINLPMLLTAHTTRKRLQGRLGDEFVDTYESGAAGGLRAKRGSQTLGPSDHILTAGDDAIDLEYFKDAVHIMEPEKEYTEASLKQKFNSFATETVSGTINRRFYARRLLFDRVCKGAPRAVEIFLRMDSNRTGRISQADWRRMLRSMQLGPKDGFTESDANALFVALDEDDSKTLEYSELVVMGQRPEMRKKVLGRLRRKENAITSHRPSAMTSPRQDIFPAKSSDWTRAQRAQSVVGVLDVAESRASKILEESKNPRPLALGEKKLTMQRLMENVDTMYGHYRLQREKLGPVRRIAGDKDGSLTALLSPRVQAPGSPPEGVALQALSSRTSRRSSRDVISPRRTSRRSSRDVISPKPPPVQLPPRTPRSPSSMYSMQTPTWVSQRGSPDLIQTPGVDSALSSPANEELPPRDQVELATPWSPASPAWYLRTGGKPPPPLHKREVNLSEISGNKLPVLMPGEGHGKFPGPPLAPRPTKAPAPVPRRARAVVPPSSQLPAAKGASPRSGTPKDGESIWAYNPEKEKQKEKEKIIRRGSSRDHQAHVHSLSAREPSAWQRELRLAERDRLLMAKTSLVTRAEQELRVKAFEVLRNTFEAADSPRLGAQLELAGFGHVGLGIDSRPQTPAEEKAMREWVGSQGLSDTDIKALKAAEKAALRASKIHELSAEEQRLWLEEPVKRTSFAPIADILQMHGVEEEFRLAGAPGLKAPGSLDGANAESDTERQDDEASAHGPGQVHRAGSNAFESESPRTPRTPRTPAFARKSSDQKLKSVVTRSVMPATRIAHGSKRK